MDHHDAESALTDAEVMVFAKGSIGYIKQLRNQCLDAEIPAMLARPCDAGKG